MDARRLAQPWARPAALYSAPGSILLKLKLGEAPEAVPSALAVRTGRSSMAQGLGVGAVDRVLSHFADCFGVVCVHTPAKDGWGDLEHALGLARTFQIRADKRCSVDGIVDALRMLHVVETVSPQYVCSVPLEATVAASDATAGERGWATREAVNGPQASAYEPGDRAVICAILDTGIVVGHPELGANVRDVGPDLVQLGHGDLAGGLELLGDDDRPDVDPEDEVGHGTACAGIIGAVGDRVPPGLALGCTVLPARVLGSAHAHGRKERVGVGRISDIDAGIKTAVDLGAKVLNMSFGTPVEGLADGDPVPHEDVVRYALARGCVLVAAAGNSGKHEAYTPACLDGVVAVGAVGDDDQPCSFSTSGSHVALCAPGWRVPSLGLDGYAVVSGTSFAAPFVSAVAALLASRAGRRASELDGAIAARVLQESARPWRRPVTGHGTGTLDALAALQALDREIDAARSPTTTNGEEEVMAR
jgi:subtilisin family serine protease